MLIRKHLDKVKNRRLRSPRAAPPQTPAGSGQETDDEEERRPRKRARGAPRKTGAAEPTPDPPPGTSGSTGLQRST